MQLTLGFQRDLLQLVHRAQQMGAAQQLRIGHGHGGVRSGMHRQRTVVLRAQGSHLLELLLLREQAGIVHQAQGDARRALLQRFLHLGQHAGFFLFREGTIHAAGHRRTGGTMARQHRHITGHSAVSGLKIRLQGTAALFGVSEAEQARTDDIHVGAVLVKAHSGNAAVAGDEGGDALADKGIEPGQGIGAQGEPVVVGVGVNKARG